MVTSATTAEQRKQALVPLPTADVIPAPSAAGSGAESANWGLARVSESRFGFQLCSIWLETNQGPEPMQKVTSVVSVPALLSFPGLDSIVGPQV